MKVSKQKLLRIRDLKLSPYTNPLIEPQTIETKRRVVRSARGGDLVDPLTGEVSAVAMIHAVEEKDDAEFVKVFAAGVKAAYGLTRTAGRVFQAVLSEYQRTPMKGGFADAVDLFWFGGGLCGRDIEMSEATFNRGLRELLTQQFLYPRSPSSYWVNPALFFKGNRVAFIREYRRRSAGQDDAEDTAQQRLVV